MELNFLTTTAAVLAANILAAMLIYGATKMAKDKMDAATASCFLVPLGFLVLALLAVKLG